MNRLSLILLGLGVVAASIGTGCGNREPGGTTTATASGGGAVSDSLARWNIVLAHMKGRDITAEDVYRSVKTGMGPDRAEQTMQNPDMLQVATAALLDQFLWAAEAERNGYHLTRGEQGEVDGLASQFLATRYMGDVVQYKADPTPQQVEEWYEANQQLYLAPARVGVRHILVADEATARRVLAEAKGGADFGDLVRRYSLDERTRDINGALGYVEQDKEVLGMGKRPEFVNALLALNPGDMTVLQTNLGWHVVRVDRKEGGGLRPLSEVREEIINGWRRRNWASVYNEELQKVRREFGGEMLAGGFEKFTGIVQNVDRLLQIAVEHPDPAGRIEVYRRVATDFQKSDKAPYAQFMIIYVNLTQLGDSYNARKALNRMRVVFPDSEWRKAADYLEQYMDPKADLTALPDSHDHGGKGAGEPIDLPSPEEILKLATGK